MPMSTESTLDAATTVAIVGMAARFPGAADVAEFWKNIREGKESLSRFTDEELLAAGIDPVTLSNPDYVKVGGALPEADLFDAEFFGFAPREAEVTDPQQRVFLECAWNALEMAGHTTKSDRLIGVYAGVAMNTYVRNLLLNEQVMNSSDPIQLMTGNDKDFAATRVSYKLNLRGPSVCIQSACSSSLVAVHFACRALLTHECDVALAGAVSIAVPLKRGYLYQDGGPESRDGRVRAFDKSANGTVFSDGAGVVVLKRLADALEDGDTIHAVIRGSAVNNDGSNKVSFTAPGVDSQADVIQSALAIAEVSPDTISYVEAHGTGTQLGDSIELAALSKAFRSGTERTRFCALGSVKTNIGHTNTVAGIAGLIKTALALTHKLLPPSLHFEEANAHGNLERSPFYVNTSLQEWKVEKGRRRAGVSSLGFGGTNAHMILEEPPEVIRPAASVRHHILPLSARTPSALEAAVRNLAGHLESGGDFRLADVAHTLQVGRHRFSHRHAIVCQSASSAVELLARYQVNVAVDSVIGNTTGSVAFLFPGQGSQYPGMGAGLYQTNLIFRETIQLCARLLKEYSDIDLLAELYPKDLDAIQAATRLSETQVTQPVLFATEYALAKVWESLGVVPQAMIGHSIGEYVAACLAGVTSLPDALRVVARRGWLMHNTEPGAMLAVSASENDISQYLTDALAIAAVNAPSACVISGAKHHIEVLEVRLKGEGIAFQRLKTSHAFHSPLMDPILSEFRKEIERTELHAPRIPYISSLTGTWIAPEEAMDPETWVQQLRQPVRFAAGMRELLMASGRTLIEVGPGQTLSRLTRQSIAKPPSPLMVASLLKQGDEDSYLLESLAKLWIAGVDIDWSNHYAKSEAKRIPLPTYPFERRRYFVDGDISLRPFSGSKTRREDAEKFYVTSWKQLVGRNYFERPQSEGRSWVVFVDGSQIAGSFVAKQRDAGNRVITVQAGPGVEFENIGSLQFRVDPLQSDHYHKLIASLGIAEPLEFVTFWARSASRGQAPCISVEDSFCSLLFLAQAIGARDIPGKTNISVISNGVAQVTAEDQLDRDKALFLGPCRTIPLEYPNLRCCLIDIGFLDSADADTVISACAQGPQASIIACRMGQHWAPCVQPVSLPAGKSPLQVRESGVYLITGGLGGIGLVLAEWLGKETKAKLVLVGRSAPPPRADWDSILEAESTSAAIRHQVTMLRGLEEAGVPVLVCQADICDETQVRSVLQQTLARFGTIHGIIHAAGVPGGGMIQFKTASAAQNVLRPKVAGTLVLERVFQSFDLDFFVACSSVSSIQSAFGQVDYCSANAFLDAFSLSNNFKPATRTVSIGWDAWKEVGMARNVSPGAGLEQIHLQRLSTALTTHEAIEAFKRILSIEKTRAHILVSREDLSAVPEPVSLQVSLQSKPDAELSLSESKHPRPNLTTPLVLPRNDLERSIAEVWQSVLGYDVVGVTDDFFELGGHSLAAVRVISRIRTAFNLDIPLQSAFELNTVEEMAKEVERRAGTQMKAPEITALKTAGDVPLSYGQQRLWFLDQLSPGSSAYNVATGLRLSGRLDKQALRSSLQQIVDRHEILRTAFVVKNEFPVQEISHALEPAIQEIDLRTAPLVQRDKQLRDLSQLEVEKPFNLSSPPLLRAALFCIEEELHVLLIVVHHIVSDGWSTAILAQELGEFYRAAVKAERPRLQELKIQYKDYAVWQRGWLNGEVLESQLHYWIRQLKGMTTLELPYDRPRPRVLTNRAASIRFALSAELTGKLKSLGRSEDCSLFMTLMAAYHCLLAWFSGNGDIAVGTDIASRHWSGTEPLIGLFVNQLVIRANLAGNPAFTEVLRNIRKASVEAYAHQDVPFDKVVEVVGGNRGANVSPLVEVKLVLQNYPTAEPFAGEAAAIQIEPEELPPGHAKFDLLLVMFEEADHLEGEIEYRTELFDQHTVEMLIRRFEQVITLMVESPDSRLDALNQELNGSQSRELRQVAARKLKAVLPARTTVAAPMS